MPFKKGNTVGKQFTKDRQPENNTGRPVGSISRSTVAKRILALKATMPKDVMDELKKVYPQIENNMTIEEAMTIVQAKQAINGDNQSYKLLMDSAFGAPKQEIEGYIDGNIILQFDKQDEMIGSDDEIE